MPALLLWPLHQVRTRAKLSTAAHPIVASHELQNAGMVGFIVQLVLVAAGELNPVGACSEKECTVSVVTCEGFVLCALAPQF
jgi:hypothetical protein